MSEEDDVVAEVTDGVDGADGTDQDGMADDWAAAMQEQGGDALSVESAELSELVDESSPLVVNEDNPDLDVILDIPVQISMVVGATQINIRNLLQLNQGSVIELDRMAGEPLDVLVNNTLIAHGEVVVVNEKFGIRLTDVVSAAERIRKLG
jgi:flagellar motor switch protein FliN/FliY